MQDRPGPSNREVLNLEQRRIIGKIMQTPSWGTFETLFIPASRVRLEQVPRDLIEPATASVIREQTFRGKLRERRQELSRVNPNIKYSIQMDTDREGATGYPALFEVSPTGGERIRMWDGTTVTLAQSGPRWEGENFSVPTYPINYSEWVACQNFRTAIAFRDEGLPLPYAGIGISVIMETADGMIPLTLRGIETPVYPGMLYSPGGGPKPGQSSTESLLEEILEETGLESTTHFDPTKLTILALVSDTHFHGSDHQRPELVASLPIDVSFSELERIQFARAKRNLKETDVWRVDPFSANSDTMPDGIIFYGNRMCPPTEAALSFYLLQKHIDASGVEIAIKQAERMMAKAESYRREPYSPPITRLFAADAS